MFSLLAIGTSRLCLYVHLSSSSFSVSLIKHEGCVELFEISRNEGFFNSGNVAWTLKDTLTVSWLRGWCKCKNDSRPHQQTRQAALRLNLQQKFSTLMELRSPERSGPIVCKCRRFLSFAFLIENKNWIIESIEASVNLRATNVSFLLKETRFSSTMEFFGEERHPLWRR